VELMGVVYGLPSYYQEDFIVVLPELPKWSLSPL